MRYLCAVLIVALSMTLDFTQESSDQSVLAESRVVGVADVQGKPLLTEAASHPGIDDVVSQNELPFSKGDLEHYTAPIGNRTSSDPDRSARFSADNVEVPVAIDRVCEAIRSAAQESGIPVGFLARLLWQESRFRSEEVSSAGARGIAQFMPQTAAEVGLTDPFDPLQAIPASARFLRKLHNQFGNLGLAAAAYNAGGGKIEKWLSRRERLPQETRAYVKIITGNKAEDWTAESKIISVSTDLPRQAPCEGVGGLSKSKHNQAAEVPVTLTPAVSEILRKAEADAVQARLKAARPALEALANARTPSGFARVNSRNMKLVATSRIDLMSRPAKKPVVRLASAVSR